MIYQYLKFRAEKNHFLSGTSLFLPAGDICGEIKHKIKLCHLGCCVASNALLLFIVNLPSG